MAPLLVSAVVLYFCQSLFFGNVAPWYHINKYSSLLAGAGS
jgi:hypothetical protein